MCGIYLILKAYASSATHLLTQLPYAGLYRYNGRQIELFYMKWFVVDSWGLCKMPEVGASTQTSL